MKSLVRNLSWTVLLLSTTGLTLPLPKSTDTFVALLAGLKIAVSVVDDLLTHPGSNISPVQLILRESAA